MTQIAPRRVVRISQIRMKLIGRKRYVVGDALGDRGWYIIKIDGPARAVMIEHRPTERTATLTVPLPR